MANVIPQDLSKATENLADAIERFDRGIGKAASKPSIARRIGRRPLPVRPAPAHRPTRHPVALPVPYRRHAAPTVLDRARALDERRHGTRPFIAAVRRATGRVTAAVRRGLSALRRGLLRLGGRHGRTS